MNIVAWQRPGIPRSVAATVALTKEDFARKLVALRERELLSQEEAARRAGIGFRQWSRWENPTQKGSSVPRLSSLQKIAEAFGVDSSYFGIDDGTTQLDRIETQLADLTAAIATVQRQQEAALEALEALIPSDQELQARIEQAVSVASRSPGKGRRARASTARTK